MVNKNNKKIDSYFDRMATSQSQTLFTVVETKVPTEIIPVRTKQTAIAEWCSLHWKAIAAEFLATMTLLLFGCMGQCKPDGMEVPLIYGALGFGTVVAMNIQIFGHISGAHMNPSVSLGAYIFGDMSLYVMLAYVVAQVGGGIVGFGLLTQLVADPLTSDNLCSTIPRTDISACQALGIEILLTASLNFANCGVWDVRNKHLQDSVPIKFGLIITGLSIAGGSLTGASMNPARSLGPSVWNDNWTHHWVYWLGPLMGGSLSALLYRLVWKPRAPEAQETQALDIKH